MCGKGGAGRHEVAVRGKEEIVLVQERAKQEVMKVLRRAEMAEREGTEGTVARREAKEALEGASSFTLCCI